ncbi:MAG: ribonuclease D, partial [Planctomycetota bacterium]
MLVFHGADYDLRLMRSSFGFRPGGGVFDTMIAAQLLGHERLGLAALVEHYFGVELSKKGKRSNWSRRPLKPAQLRYASDDVRYLGGLADRLEADLRRLGRLEWHGQSCAAVVEATAQDRHQDARRVWRIKGLRGLD